MVEVRRGRRVLPRLRVLVVGVRRGRRGTLHRLGVVALVVGRRVPRVGRRELGVVALLVAGRRARLVSRRLSQDLTLEGSVVVDPATEVKATAAGKVARFEVSDGDYVEVGAPLLTVTREEQGEATQQRDEAVAWFR